MAPAPHEIVVFGGGAAGCTAARLLARWGHAVRLVTRPAPEGVGLAVSLTPSCGKFFDLLGIRDAIDAAGFVPTTGNTVWWGSETVRVEPFQGGATGWQVTTPRLEAVLRASVAAAGVTIDERLVSAEDAAAWPARFRLDCTGRTGVLARARAGRVYEPGHRTVALSAVWQRRQPWPLPDPSHTVIESYADGWAWSVPIDARRRAVAVMVDPRTSSLRRGEGPEATYRAELQKTTRFRELLADAEQGSGPAGWDASMYRSEQYAGDDWLLAGDAASFVDPLSSAGVKKALASGWLAAIVVHTVLTTPSMGAAARGFFAEREAEMYRGFLALTNQYLGEASNGQSHPFWTDRLETGDEPPASRSAGERTAVEAAFARLRATPRLRLQRAPGTRVEARPAISGSTIVMEPRLVSGDGGAGVRFLHDVDVVTLVELAPGCEDVPELFDACVRRSGPIDLARFLTALSTAIARGWLEFAPDVGPTPPESRPEV